MRTALRADLFSRPTRERRAAQSRHGLGRCLYGAMAHAVASDDAKPLESFTAAFEAHGVALDGKTFLQTLGGLCGDRPHGTLIDIVPLRRRVAHSWHQDSGISSMTVLLGFPPRDGYEGGGVFSHHVKLSHALRPSFGDTHGAVVEYERLQDRRCRRSQRTISSGRCIAVGARCGSPTTRPTCTRRPTCR